MINLVILILIFFLSNNISASEVTVIELHNKTIDQLLNENIETIDNSQIIISDDNSSANECNVLEAKEPYKFFIQYSMIFFLGSNGTRSSKPIDFTAI